MSSIRISIIIPSYQQAPFLERALRSVLNQGYPALECLVFDGGSTDGSVPLLQRYSARLTHWQSAPDGGQAHAINQGLARATGQLVGFLNSDDLSLPGALAAVARAYREHPKAAYFYGDSVMIDERDRVIGMTWVETFDPLHRGWNLKSEAFFWTRPAGLAAGSFDEKLRFALDVDWAFRLWKVGPGHKIERPLGAFRVHPQAKSATIPEVGREEFARVCARHFPGQTIPTYPGLHWRHHLRLCLRHPRLVLLPYLRYRIQEFRKGSRE